MEFTFETHYNAATMTVMARALRKTVRKAHSRRSHLFGWVVVLLAVLLLLADGFAPDLRTIVTAAAALAVVAALLLEDRINGFAASRRLLRGTETAVTVFSESGFVTTTEVGRTEWKYDRILQIAETDGFFVLIFSASHAQLYDKQHLQGGTPEEFRRFLETATGQSVVRVA